MLRWPIWRAAAPMVAAGILPACRRAQHARSERHVGCGVVRGSSYTVRSMAVPMLI